MENGCCCFEAYFALLAYCVNLRSNLNRQTMALQLSNLLCVKKSFPFYGKRIILQIVLFTFIFIDFVQVFDLMLLANFAEQIVFYVVRKQILLISLSINSRITKVEAKTVVVFSAELSSPTL